MDKSIALAVARVNRGLLRKSAAAYIQKRAGIIADEIAGIPGGALADAIVPGADSMARVGGVLHGALSSKPTKEEIDAIENNGIGYSFIPGFGPSRALRKKRYYSRNTPHGTANIAGEYLGSGAATLLAALGGAGIGAGAGALTAGKGERGAGAGYGALIGAAGGAGVSLLARLAGSIAAAAVARRTAAQQNAYDSSVSASNWMLPGAAEYNYWKRVGAIRGIEKEDEERRSKKSKA